MLGKELQLEVLSECVRPWGRMSAAGDGSGSTPPTPIASTASPVPPISPFLTPAAAAAGIR